VCRRKKTSSKALVLDSVPLESSRLSPFFNQENPAKGFTSATSIPPSSFINASSFPEDATSQLKSARE
jgi:hypothetical protein